MENLVLEAQIRSDYGKNKSRQIRNKGFIPAVIYSHGKTEAIQITNKSFKSLFKGHISESKIFTINIKDKKNDSKLMAFVKSFQKHPVSDEIIHLDLFKITKGEKIQTVVPIEVVGSAKGVKMGGVLEKGEREIEVECLPKDLPEVIEVDISNLGIDQAIHAKDIELDEAITILTNPDTVIAAVHVARVAEEEETEEEETEEAGEETKIEDSESTSDNN